MDVAFELITRSQRGPTHQLQENTWGYAVQTMAAAGTPATTTAATTVVVEVVVVGAAGMTVIDTTIDMTVVAVVVMIIGTVNIVIGTGGVLLPPGATHPAGEAVLGAHVQQQALVATSTMVKDPAGR